MGKDMVNKENDENVLENSIAELKNNDLNVKEFAMTRFLDDTGMLRVHVRKDRVRDVTKPILQSHLHYFSL